MKNNDINLLFEPRSVAVMGVSHDSNKVGYKILENIIDGGYKGKIFLVNHKGGEIMGLEVYKSLLEAEEEIDMVIISVPAKNVFEVVEDCAKKKVKYLVIIASGFSEIGNTEEEKKIVDFANNNGMRVLGPNIFGVYSSKVNLNATFGTKGIIKGGAAIISQSGALGIALMGKAQTENVGLSSVVFEGNKADINGTDLLPYFKNDKNTKVIFIYIEGVKQGEKLVKALKEVTMIKPVVILKAGISEKGARAALSHTGSLAGEDKIFSSAMEQAGVIRAGNLKDAMNWVKYLSEAKVPEGENCLIITNGGGMGILASDSCEKYNIKLIDDIPFLQNCFGSLIRGFGSVKNPIDVTGEATAEDYKNILEKALSEENIHSIICLGCETAVLNNSELAVVFRDLYQKSKKIKPTVFAFVGGKEVEEKLMSLKEKGVPIFPEIEEAVSCLGAVYRHSQNLKGGEKTVRERGEIREIGKIRERLGQGRKGWVLPNEARELLQMAGISFPKTGVAKNTEEVRDIAMKIGFPVAMKIVSKDIIHKTEAGGVILDIKTETEAEEAFKTILENCKRRFPLAKIDGVEITEMVKDGVEVIVGAKKDRDFGNVTMFGLGGIYTEILKDVSFRVLPVDIDEARKMIEETKTFSILSGARGEKKKDIKSICEIILKLGLIIENCPQIAEIEINPLKVFEEGKGATALDVRMLIS